MNRTLCVLVVAALLAVPAWGEVSVSTIFGDHMVLQREQAVAVWGQADPGEQVRVTIAGQTQTATADADGNWSVTLQPMPAGGPHEFNVNGHVIKDVLIGDVWIAGGQSNMAFALKSDKDAKAAIAAAAGHPKLRLMTVPGSIDLQPRAELPKAEWQVSSPKTVPPFSAIGYYFGRDLLGETDIPQGIISANRGATRIETWMSEPTLKQFPEYADTDLAALKASHSAQQKRFIASVNAWRKRIDAADAGLAGEWASPELDDGDWKTMDLPTHWEKAGLEGLDGVVWFRRTVEIPADFDTKCIMLRLASTDDFSDVYFNGRLIDSTGPEDPGAWQKWRLAYVPSDALNRGGQNVIAVRVTDIGGEGGGIWKAAGWHDMFITDCVGPKISLTGEWKYRLGADAEQLNPLPALAAIPADITDPNRTAVLYNGMIHPLHRFAARGFIWYQGESNAWTNATRYDDLLAAMIENWRDAWGNQEMPFLIVQLTSYYPPADQPAPAPWATLRESQLEVLRRVPRTGLAVTLDVGDAKDIHPTDKAPVAHRLALWALKLVYGRDIPAAGPIYRDVQIEGDKARVTFDHAAGGLTTTDGKAPARFEIAGEDRNFVWAEAKIDGDSVIVSSPQVPAPAAVRYAWANNPEGANLANSAGLLASPFRTDDWDK